MKLIDDRAAWTLPSPVGNDAIVLYQAEDGTASLEVRLQEETVWLSLTQMAELFDRDKSVISWHLRNIFREGESVRAAVVAKNATTAADGKTYQVDFFNLDAIISVGYRVNSKRGTQFRIWASSVLKEYLIKGYAFNQRRLAEQGVAELRGVLDLLASTLEKHQLADAARVAVVDLVWRCSTPCSPKGKRLDPCVPNVVKAVLFCRCVCPRWRRANRSRGLSAENGSGMKKHCIATPCSSPPRGPTWSRTASARWA